MRKPLFDKVCIIGVGLIGGSIGVALKKRRLARWVVGVARKDDTAKKAVCFNAVDMATKDLKEGVHGADVVILCTPVSTIIEQLKKIDPFVRPGILVMDVGSSKVLIEKTAAKHVKRAIFVGCHPMAGSEKQGVEFADANLFEDATCFMTGSHAKATKFWRSIGAIPYPISARRHDEWVSKVSHLPHLLSFALFQNFNKRGTYGIEELNPSLRDLARLSQSDPRLWSDIFLSNKEELLKSIREFQSRLNAVARALKNNNRAALSKFISRANAHSR